MNRQRRIIITFIIVLIAAGASLWSDRHQQLPPQPVPQTTPESTAANLAATVLAALPIKGRAPMTGYSRAQFGNGWATVGSCDEREHILARDLSQVTYRGTTCVVESGTLQDPYTGKTIAFTRGATTSALVQIDHVVALGDAWQKGAQALSVSEREQLYNDPLELLAVDGDANQQKGDSDAASWLPPNTAFRCQYVARQIAVKQKYHLWVTQAEHDAMTRILSSCPSETIPSAGA